MNKIKNNLTNFYKIALFGIFLASLCACDQVSDSRTTNSQSSRTTRIQKPHKHLWGRIRNNFEMKSKPIKTEEHQRIQKYVKKYSKEEKNLNRISLQAAPYLYYIVEQLEMRNMPGELALLPMIESAFLPQANSNRGAAGIWQFMPGTGRMYGLKQDAWYDGRRDIKASTRAALDFLTFLHDKFDGDWMLALAAYNAGEGAVERAIKRNRKAGKPTTFWDLNLPKQTQEYVPKFLALAQVIGNPEAHAITLPDIDNVPYFAHVNPGTHLHLNQVAKLANIDISELKRLNPGFRRASTHPTGPQELLLPVANIRRFQYNLVNKKR